MIGAIRSETGVSADTYNLTLTVNIHTTGTSSYGPIDETFTPAMKGTINGNVLTWDKTLTVSKAGVIKQTAAIANTQKILGLSIAAAQVLFVCLTFIFAATLIFLALAYFTGKKTLVSSFERETQKIQKKYGIRIIEASDSAHLEAQNSVSTNTIEDLIKVADELGKPIVHQSADAQELEIYYVIDGQTRYHFSLAGGKFDQPVQNDEANIPA